MAEAAEKDLSALCALSVLSVDGFCQKLKGLAGL